MTAFKPPALPESLMEPERAIRILRDFDANMLKRPLRYELAAVIENLMKKAGIEPAPALVALKDGS